MSKRATGFGKSERKLFTLLTEGPSSWLYNLPEHI